MLVGEKMKNAKCTNCGANIEVDETKEAGVCKYCNSAYVTEKAIQNYNTNVTNNATNNAQTIVNNYYTAAPVQENVRIKKIIPTEPRPKINVGLAILLCWLYIIPGIIYIGSVRNKQREWDEKYGVDDDE